MIQPVHMSDNGVRALAGYEATILHEYYDVAGILTVCTGHVVQPGEDWSSVTRDKCDAALSRDVSRFERCVASHVLVPYTQPMFDALCSLCFNIGETAFESSSVLRFLNMGNYLAAADAFKLWCNARVKQTDGTYVKKPVLLGRREAEARMFRTGIGEITIGTVSADIPIADLVAATQFDLRNTRVDLPAGIDPPEDHDAYSDDGRLIAMPPDEEELARAA